MGSIQAVAYRNTWGPVSRLLSPGAVLTRTGVFLRLLSSTAIPNDMLELSEIVEERLVSFVICGASNGFVAQILHDSSHFGSVSRSKLVGRPLRRVNEAPSSYRDDGRSGTVTALPPLLPDEVPARRKVCLLRNFNLNLYPNATHFMTCSKNAKHSPSLPCSNPILRLEGLRGPHQEIKLSRRPLTAWVSRSKLSFPMRSCLA